MPLDQILIDPLAGQSLLNLRLNDRPKRLTEALGDRDSALQTDRPAAADPGIGFWIDSDLRIASGAGSDPGIGFVAGFESAGGEWTCRATVSRSIPSSPAIRR